VAYIKHTLNSDLSIYDIMQILKISAFDKTPIRELLTKEIDNQTDTNQLTLVTTQLLSKSK
jgi:hypothetical protein